jgi:D-amino-acid dehydrogenase
MTKRVAIIGGGVIGLCSAYYCAKAGHQVTVSDRNPKNRDGCSFGNAGMIVPSHFVPLAAPGMVGLGLRWMWNPESPFYIRPRLDLDLLRWAFRFWQASSQKHVDRCAPVLRDLNQASRQCYEELAFEWGDSFVLHKRGLLMLCKEASTLEHEAKHAERANAIGVQAEVLNEAATAKIDPGIEMDVCGSVYFPNDCHLTPGRFMEALLEKCMALGVRFRWRSEVQAFERQRNRLTGVRISGDVVEADEVVLGGGSWSEALVRDLGLKLPMQAGKGYSLTHDRPRQLPSLCSILTEARVAVTPMNGSLRVGGTMELSGLNESVDLRRVQGIIKSIPNYFPQFKIDDFKDLVPWQGLRPCSPDGMPYLGRTKKVSNLVIATGHAMMGLSLGPITGKIVQEIVSESNPSFSLELLSPDRYAP